MTREEIIKGLESVKKECGRHFDESFAWICEPIDRAIELIGKQQKPIEKFENAKDHIFKLAGDYKCWDNRLTEEEAVELCHILEQQPSDEDVQRVVDYLLKPISKTITSKDCASLEAYKQVTHERDTAIKQLKELGYELGEKIRTSDDCVSREQALKELKESAEHHANDSREEVLLRRDRDIIRALPPVTPTHRMCKDCTKSKILNGFEGYSIVCSRFGRMAVNPDFYCADFEKRGSENDI